MDRKPKDNGIIRPNVYPCRSCGMGRYIDLIHGSAQPGEFLLQDMGNESRVPGC
jgi:hypothetical protein